MAVLIPHFNAMMNPAKHTRRNATAVMAGAFDVRPPRDVLTSLLNGVGPYKVVEKDEETRRTRKRERREQNKERKKQKTAAKARQRALLGEAGAHSTFDSAAATSNAIVQPQASGSGTSSFWRARPSIQIASCQRSVSVTPPPVSSPLFAHSSRTSTPGPSNSSSTSRTSSKRPHTPDDYDYLNSHELSMSTGSPSQQARRKRVAVKKGWKGWVEGSPPPSEKLINLDAVPILQERRTRSGKNFDAIGVGKDGWV